MRPSQILHTFSLFCLPLLFMSLVGCNSTQTNEEKNTSETNPVEDSSPVQGLDGRPVLNPEGTVGPSSAVVIFPNGNESLVAGNSYEIAWEAQGFNKINIGLEEEGYFREELAQGILVAEKKFAWTPTLSQGRADDHIMSLQVVLSDFQTGEVLDKSDGSFIIIEEEKE